MTRIWEDVLGAEDREIIERGGYGRTRGLGMRPALVIIDCQYNHIGADKPILEQLDEWPAGAGERGWRIVQRIQPVLEAARHSGVPVVYTRYCHSEQGARFDSFAKKRGRDLSAFVDGVPGTRIVSELAPADGDLVIDKVHASAFYGTALLSYLIGLQVDSLLVTGVSTSGCVRATAVEAASLNYNVGVLADCVTDRILVSHKASLLDLWMKYGDVLDSEAACAYLKQLSVRDEAAEPLSVPSA